MKRLAWLALGLSVGCDSGSRRHQLSDAEAIGAAKTAAEAAFARLSGELSLAVAEGGTASAIDVCSKRATEIASEVAGQHGVRLVRLSDKPRNPEQEATGRDLAAVRFFRESAARGEELRPRIERSGEGEVVVRMPITLSSPLCLRCHGSGDEIDAETRAALSGRYPDDRATGYSLYDLRGIWKVGVSDTTDP